MRIRTRKDGGFMRTPKSVDKLPHQRPIGKSRTRPRRCADDRGRRAGISGRRQPSDSNASWHFPALIRQPCAQLLARPDSCSPCSIISPATRRCSSVSPPLRAMIPATSPEPAKSSADRNRSTVHERPGRPLPRLPAQDSGGQSALLRPAARRGFSPIPNATPSPSPISTATPSTRRSKNATIRASTTSR